MIWDRVVRPLLFTCDSEQAHAAALRAAAILDRAALHATALTAPELRTNLAGVPLPNPVGLSAGCDKNAVALRAWPWFGFGFVECGTVTPRPQRGNPRPRVFRYPALHAVVNRLGFNSDGADVVAARLRQYRASRRSCVVPIGANIGRNRESTSEQAAAADYVTAYRALAPYADYVVVNVSSPNTPGLRDIQEATRLAGLVSRLCDEGLDSGTRGARPPLFVKIAPDLHPDAIRAAVTAARDAGAAGIVAVNTTVRRDGAAAAATESGGLSGRPLHALALECVRLVHGVDPDLPIIGVGGVASAADAIAMIRAGASAIQLYTALVYEGPMLAARIARGIRQEVVRLGLDSVAQLVGAQA